MSFSKPDEGITDPGRKKNIERLDLITEINRKDRKASLRLEKIAKIAKNIC